MYFIGLLIVLHSFAFVSAFTPSPWMNQGWFFSWDPSWEPTPIPTTAQCDTLEITWQRSTATGPDGVAPYYLQIYTSAYVFPLIIPAGSLPATNFTVPFSPGTQYQICMFDSMGSTGGCQAIYTVYPAPNTTAENPPSCANVTFPAQSLNVTSGYSQGTLSQYGWPDQCSDIMVTPQEGTPPFIFTVAPALHPPLNFTSNSMNPVNWTVSLSWGSPFFISVVDSTGLSWAHGPLHSGEGDTSCLSVGATIPDTSKTVKVFVAVVAGIAGLVAGGLLTALFGIFFRRFRGRKDEFTGSGVSATSGVLQTDDYGQTRPEYYRSLPSSPPVAGTSHYEVSEARHGNSMSINDPRMAARSNSERSRHQRDLSGAYEIEPFQFNNQQPQPARTLPSPRKGDPVPTDNVNWSSVEPTGPSFPSDDAPGSSSASQAGRGSHVYVVHHDGGRPPVSVYAADGTEIVELPPQYPAGSSDADAQGRQRLNRFPSGRAS